MSGTVHFEAGPALPSLPEGDRLRALLTQALADRGVSPLVPTTPLPWDADFFGLSHIRAFRAADAEAQARVLAHACEGVLQEALQIETLGMAYAAKMTLLAPTLEERSLYALFTAEEATHLTNVSSFVSRREVDSPFLDLLRQLTEQSDRAGLVLLVQVVLEGWGLDHYRGLARSCRDPGLTRVLEGILRDEARHHGSGVVLAPRLGVPEGAEDVLASFCQMVRVGPQGLLSALEHGLGPLPRSSRVRALEELDTRAHAGRRLTLLRELLERVGADALIHTLDTRGCFTPLDPEEAA